MRLRSAGHSLGWVVLGLGSSGCFMAPPQASGDADSTTADSARCVEPDDAETLADQVLQLVNLERGEAGLPPVGLSPTLGKMAADFACRMIEDAFFDHHDPSDGSGPGERAIAQKYAFFAIGENLAAGQESAADVMRLWMESPAHQSVILDERWTEVGIAVRTGGEFGIYWVQEFGDPTE